MYPRNAASPEPIAIGAVVQISDGAVQTSGVTVRIKPIGVAEADGLGSTDYSTDGIVMYTPTQTETNYTSFILIAKKTGCIPAPITIVTTASVTPGTVLLAPTTHTSAVVPTVSAVTGLTASNLDATVSSRMATFSLPANFSLLGINGSGHISRVTLVDTTTTNSDAMSALGIRNAVGLVAANMDTQFSGIQSDVDNIQTRLPSVLISGRMDASVGAIANNAITASSIAANALDGKGDWSTTTPPTAASIATQVWSEAVPGAYGAGTAGNRLDAAITSRMATYTQPTGFLAATFPTGTIANTTNITSATGITVSTNSDKTGYSLSQAFPTNFSSLSIDGSGRILLQPTQTGVTIPTVSTVTNAIVLPTIPSNWITAAGINAGALNGKGDWNTTTPPSAASIATQVWSETLPGSYTSNQAGFKLNGAASAGDPWLTSLPGAYGAGTAGNIIGNRLDAAVTSRMATYTQPTGFLAATFPTGTIANTTNITAATGITVSTNSDKTGYSLSQTFPANFSALSVDVSGRVLLQPTQTGVTIPTVTAVTNAIVLPSIPNNWITAAGINAGALNGKGDWSTYAGADTSGTTTLLARLTSGRAGNLDNLDATISSRLSTLGTNAPTDWFNAAAISTNAVDKITTGILDDPLANHLTLNSVGYAISTASQGFVDANSVRTALGMASANMDTQLLTIASNAEAALIDTNELQTDWANGGRLDLILDSRASQTSVDTLLNRITSTLFSGITSLSQWLGALAGKTPSVVTRGEINATTAGVNYNETTDSQEAIRDRGDSTWSGGSGGGITANIMPYFSQVTPRVSNNTISLFFREQTDVIITVVDANGDPINMSLKTLEFNIESADRINVVTILDGDITKSTTSATVNIGTVVTNELATFLWSLRDITLGDTVLSSGVINVIYAPRAQ